MAVFDNIRDDLDFARGTTINVVYNPKADILKKTKAYAVAYPSPIDQTKVIEIVLGVRRYNGLTRSLIAEELFHASDYSNGLIQSFNTNEAEIRAISFVLANRENIGFNTTRAEELNEHLDDYTACANGRSTDICDP